MSWQVLYWNQDNALQRGEYDDARLSGWGRLQAITGFFEHAPAPRSEP